MASNKTKSLIIGAMIAAIYATFTLIGSVIGISYGPIQFRFSEALTILPVFTSMAIPGLSIGCLIANIFSPYPLDMVFGTVATLLAAIFTYILRNVRLWSMPILAPLPPIIFNAIIIGVEISIATPGARMAAFLINALTVGLGQLVVCYGLGLPLYTILNKTKLFNEMK